MSKNPIVSKSSKISEDELILKEAKKMVAALGKMFAPCCEVVLHDLRNPTNSIIALETPLSGRKLGDSMTEMGLARLSNPDFPDIIQNYSNTFPDGRPVKSTSIGLRNSKGEFIAALCLNLDISIFSSLQLILGQLTATNVSDAPVAETLHNRSSDEIRQAIETFSAKRNTQPRALSSQQRQELVKQLANAGFLQFGGAISKIANLLGISRASVYNSLKAVN